MMPPIEWLDDAGAEQRWIAACLRDPGAGLQLAACAYLSPVLLLSAKQASDPELTQRAERLGLPCRRRHGGGAAVLAGAWMVSMNLWVPARVPGLPTGLVALRTWLGRIHARALGELGVPAQCASSTAQPEGEDHEALRAACFGSTSVGEVVDMQGRKIVGISQHRSALGTWLGAGTLVADCDWSLLGDALGLPPAWTHALAKRTASCQRPTAAVLGRIAAQVRRAIADLPSANAPKRPQPATAAV